MMAAVMEAVPAPRNIPPSPPVSANGRPDSCVSMDTVVTESVARDSTHLDEGEEGDESLVLAIRALRLLENPQAAAAEAIQAFDPKANLHPDLVRLLVAAAVRHPDVAQNLIELGQGHSGQLLRRTPSGSLQATGDGAGRHASGLLHEISISSLLSSINESSSRRALEAAAATDAAAKPTLKRRLSVLSTKKAASEQQVMSAPPARKEKISIDSIKKICKANLKDTQESIEKLEMAELNDEFISVDELKRMAEESLGHETGKFALCLALTLRDADQRWEATKCLMTAMVDKLKLLLTIRGRFGPDGDVGLPGQDGFGIRDCWVVLSEAERERLALEEDGKWPKHLREAAQRAPRHGAKAWEILTACDKIQEAFAPSPRSSVDDTSMVSADEDGEEVPETPKPNAVAKRHAMSAASPQEITDRWAFFFDLLDEEAARRCFRELRLLRQLFNAADASSAAANGNKAANLKSRAKNAFNNMSPRQDEDQERWLDTKWAMTAMKSFLMSKVGTIQDDVENAGGASTFEKLDKLDNAFCRTFWACLGSGDHKRLAKEDGRQWVMDIMKVFEDRRRYDVMFRLRDIMHFMQANM